MKKAHHQAAKSYGDFNFRDVFHPLKTSQMSNISSLNNSIVQPNCKKHAGGDSIYKRSYFTSGCGDYCKNIGLMKTMEGKIKELTNALEQMKVVHEYLIFNIEQKDLLYMKLVNENAQMKDLLGYYNRSKTSKKTYELFKNKAAINIVEKLKDEVAASNDNSPSKKISIVSKERRSSLQAILAGFIKKSIDSVQTENNEPEKVDKEATASPNTASENLGTIKIRKASTIREFNTTQRGNKRASILQTSKVLPKDYSKAVNHYEKIHEMSLRNKHHKYKGESRASFLAMNDDTLKKMLSNQLMKELYQLTLSDEEFVEAIRGVSEEKLISYCDVIGNLIKDYQYSIKLIQRLKNFLKVTVQLVRSILLQDSTMNLIKNACDTLDCERTTLFVYDNITNMLIVHTGEGLKKNELRVSLDKGIVAEVFNTGERIRLDDAYLDERFNREFDKKLNFRTRTILCMPLKDSNGKTFGVIQSINKKNGLFTPDDEEIMEIFSAQASIILTNSMNWDEVHLHSSRMKWLLNYCLELDGVENAAQFTLLSEEVLMTIWNTNVAQFLFYDNQNESLVKILKYSKEEKRKNLGIVHYSIKSKEYYGCNTTQDDQYFNNIVDLDTEFALVSFPIYHPNQKDIIAVFQFSYFEKLTTKYRRMKEFDSNVIDLYIKVASQWIAKNISKIFLN